MSYYFMTCFAGTSQELMTFFKTETKGILIDLNETLHGFLASLTVWFIFPFLLAFSHLSEASRKTFRTDFDGIIQPDRQRAKRRATFSSFWGCQGRCFGSSHDKHTIGRDSRWQGEDFLVSELGCER